MFLTLLVIPVVYVWFESLRSRVSTIRTFRFGKGSAKA